MRTRKLLHRFELTFWIVLIKLMTEAPGFSRFLIGTRQRVRSGDLYRLANRALIWSLLGLGLGFLLGVFSRLIL